MASPRTRQIDREPGGHGPHESGTRRILREDASIDFAQPEDPWASEAPQSLLSVASWLVDSVRGTPESKPPPDLPAITITDVDLSAEELAAVEAESGVDRPRLADGSAVAADVSADIEIDQAVLSFEEAEAVDDFDLGPLRQSFERGDHVGLLGAAEALLELRPSMAAALPYLTAARESLRRRYMTELGGQQEVPRRLLCREVAPLARLGLDEASMLGLIDGQSTLEEIVDRSGLPQIRALQLVDRLCALGLVACGARHASYV